MSAILKGLSPEGRFKNNHLIYVRHGKITVGKKNNQEMYPQDELYPSEDLFPKEMTGGD